MPAVYVTCSTCGNLFPAPAHHDANSECPCCAEIASLNTRIDDMVARLVTASDSMCGRIFGVMAALQDRIDRLVVLRAAQV